LISIKNYISEHVLRRSALEKEPAEAYDLWSDDYDAQPGNLMLDLDEIIFMLLLNNLDLQNKAVADIGCGTGRHWHKLLNKKPSGLTGFDVSQGMLDKLKKKFPKANVCRIYDDQFSNIPSSSFDVLISTLTIAHIQDIGLALNAWCHMLKKNADIIITDFHPKLLASGGRRTFSHNNRHMAVRNYVYHIHTIKNLLLKHGFITVAEEEFSIDETVKHYYEAQNALSVYQQFKGFPVIYGIHLRRGYGLE
jgi:ubiquinone/menaquinone biosynthesis C-methylase UbiE